MWLRERSPALPDRFRAELESAYASIVENPGIYPVIHRRFRRALLHKFPYSVFYVVEPSVVVVMAVVHQTRDESTWKRRA